MIEYFDLLYNLYFQLLQYARKAQFRRRASAVPN